MSKFKNYVYKLCSMVLVLLIALLIEYLWLDPYHILGTGYFPEHNHLELTQRNHLSTNVFLKYNKEQKFRSFIFGSKTAAAFQTKDFDNLIGNTGSFQFCGENENIKNIRQKLEFIEKNGNAIENVLLVFDTHTFDSNPEVEHLADVRFSHENKILYHLKFFWAFIKNIHFVSAIELKINKNIKPDMHSNWDRRDYFLYPSNDINFKFHNKMLKDDSLQYYESKVYTEREKYQSEPHNMIPHINHIDSTEISELYKIIAVFKRKKTHYAVIVPPLFDRRKINEIEKNILKGVFGDDKVYDFSGRNKFTNYSGNYYNMAYFKPSVAANILQEINNW